MIAAYYLWPVSLFVQWKYKYSRPLYLIQILLKSTDAWIFFNKYVDLLQMYFLFLMIFLITCYFL